MGERKADVQKILRKREWTAKDLGILDVTNWALSFKSNQQKTEYETLYDVDKFNAGIEKIYGTEEAYDFNRYMWVKNWLSIYYNVAQSFLQQAQLHRTILTHALADAIAAEDVFEHLEKLPVIMTEKQYKEAEAGDGSQLQSKRALTNGVAILRASDTARENPCVDKNGYCTEQALSDVLAAQSLESFNPDTASGKANIQKVSNAIRIFSQSYYYLTCFNYTLEAIKRILWIEGLDVFAMSLTYLEEETQAYNNQLEKFHWHLYGGENERKLETLDRVFKPIDCKALTFPELKHKQLDKWVRNYKAFQMGYRNEFIFTFFDYKEPDD